MVLPASLLSVSYCTEGIAIGLLPLDQVCVTTTRLACVLCVSVEPICSSDSVEAVREITFQFPARTERLAGTECLTCRMHCSSTLNRQNVERNIATVHGQQRKQMSGFSTKLE